MFDKIFVKKLTIFLGIGPNSQMAGQIFTAGENRKIYVYPGRYAAVETMTANGKVVQEFNFGQFGWEYTIDDDGSE